MRTDELRRRDGNQASANSKRHMRHQHSGVAESLFSQSVVVHKRYLYLAFHSPESLGKYFTMFIIL